MERDILAIDDEKIPHFYCQGKLLPKASNRTITSKQLLEAKYALMITAPVSNMH